MKANPVTIVRFVRPITIWSAPFADNMFGATLYVELNYETRKVKFGYSICIDDNFNRKEGTKYAKIRFDETPETLDMPEQNFEGTSVTAYIMENLDKTNIPVINRERLLAMWFAG